MSPEDNDDAGLGNSYQYTDDAQQQLIGEGKGLQHTESATKLRAIASISLLIIAGLLTILYTNVQQKATFANKINSDLSMVITTKTSSYPNIIFILADDMGYNSLNEGVSPFLYNLSKNSISLINYYSQETCTPSRASLLTGRYPLSIGAQSAEYDVDVAGGLNLNETLIAEVLQDYGYTTYLFGKWNLGNSSPRYLPTARGFSYYLGFLDGFSTYWSKLIPDLTSYKDFLYSNSDCFYMYDSSDYTLYSTHIYEDKAVAAINSHDFSDPMFMLLSFQAVHDPFGDSKGGYASGIPKSYLASDVFSYIVDNYPGTVEQDYMKSLAVLDTSISGIYDSLKSNGQLDNTYIIFASDNGGCPGGGGRNYPLRGTKGSLFEGGFRVESFVYSPKLSPMNYTSLFHVSDWFPTILDMADISYTATDSYDLDGVSHFDNFAAGNATAAVREYMLYNYYYTASSSALTVPFAIRDNQYKLMHAYNSSTASLWYDASIEYPDSDDSIDVWGSCSQSEASSTGVYTKYLFDLTNDPDEKVNLYDSTTKLKNVQDVLYAKLAGYLENIHEATGASDDDDSTDTLSVWKTNNDYAVPWEVSADGSTLIASRSDSTAPSNCGLYSAMGASEYSALPAFANAVNPSRALLRKF